MKESLPLEKSKGPWKKGKKPATGLKAQLIQGYKQAKKDRDYFLKVNGPYSYEVTNSERRMTALKERLDSIKDEKNNY